MSRTSASQGRSWKTLTPGLVFDRAAGKGVSRAPSRPQVPRGIEIVVTVDQANGAGEVFVELLLPDRPMPSTAPSQGRAR